MGVVNLPRNVAAELLHFLSCDWATYSNNFLWYSLLLEAQKREWQSYWYNIMDSGAPIEEIRRIGGKVSVLRHRIVLFLDGMNSRHLRRSLNNDPPRSRATYMGVLSVEVSKRNLPHNLLHSSVVHVSPLSRENVVLQIPLLQYGYPGISVDHPIISLKPA